MTYHPYDLLSTELPPKAPAPNTILWGVRGSTGEFGTTESLANYMREIFTLCFLGESCGPGELTLASKVTALESSSTLSLTPKLGCFPVVGSRQGGTVGTGLKGESEG